MANQEVEAIIEAALREDMPEGDITSESIIAATSISEAVFLAKEDGVLAGLHVARRVFERIDPSVEFSERLEDGAAFKKSDILARLKFVSRDEEGELYERSSEVMVQALSRGGDGPARYLHVTCPSTGAEYLLEVPLSVWDGKETVQLDSPKAARRWTFDLPPNAEFVKEA